MKNLFFFLVVLFLFTCASCHLSGKGKMIYTLETREALTPASEMHLDSILQNRLKTLGVDEPDVAIKNDKGRLVVEISEMSNYENIKEDIRHALQDEGKLELWETYNLQEIVGDLQYALKRKVNPADTIPDSSRYNRFASMVSSPNTSPENSCLICYFKTKDTAAINGILDTTLLLQIFPNDLRFAWYYPNERGFCGLLCLRSNSYGKARITQPKLATVKLVSDKNPEIYLEMEGFDADAWKRMTRESRGKCVALAVDGTVYTYPTVQAEIDSGIFSIVGNFSKKEFQLLTAILQSGPLPTSTHIVEMHSAD